MNTSVTKKNHPVLLAIGECMAELIISTDDTMRVGFAGDTYNALVYAKRWYPDIEVQYSTATGIDTFSQRMRTHWASHGIEDQFALSTSRYNAGVYLIETDDQGERNFVYWRESSAAKQMVNLGLAKNGFLPQCDLIFFSGIALGILDDDGKTQLLDRLNKLRAQGTRVAFDPNYRSSLWENSEHAKKWMTKAFAISDIGLPGLDDQYEIFGHQSIDDVRSLMASLFVPEVILKAGKMGTYGYIDNVEVYHHEFTPAPQQVDSTAAGDSFAGIYLASRLHNDALPDAIRKAADVARFVVQHKGAIVQSNLFNDFVASYK